MKRINATEFEFIKSNYPDLNLFCGIVGGRYVERLYNENHELVASAVCDRFRNRFRLYKDLKNENNEI